MKNSRAMLAAVMAMGVGVMAGASASARMPSLSYTKSGSGRGAYRDEVGSSGDKLSRMASERRIGARRNTGYARGLRNWMDGKPSKGRV